MKNLSAKINKWTYLSCERLGAHVATVWGISGMLTEMIIEVFFPGERPLAKLTPVWRFASVDAHMIRQMLLTSKWLGAEVTSVWRFACMLTHVIGQMFLPREGFGAILALVRWLTRVLPDVVHQVILPRKCFRTVLTAEGRLPCLTFYNEFATFKRERSTESFRTWCYPAQGEFARCNAQSESTISNTLCINDAVHLILLSRAHSIKEN